MFAWLNLGAFSVPLISKVVSSAESEMTLRFSTSQSSFIHRGISIKVLIKKRSCQYTCYQDKAFNISIIYRVYSAYIMHLMLQRTLIIPLEK